MKRFEYLSAQPFYGESLEPVHTILDRFGEEGWEMCGVEGQGKEAVFYFKREKE